MYALTLPTTGNKLNKPDARKVMSRSDLLLSMKSDERLGQDLRVDGSSSVSILPVSFQKRSIGIYDSL